MKNHTVTRLMLVLLITSTAATPLVCNKPEKYLPSSSFSVDVNIPSFDEKKIQTTLLSSIGFVASSIALVLIAKGAIAHSTPQPADASTKLHAPTLFGYGFPLLAAGILTIFHPQVRDFLNS